MKTVKELKAEAMQLKEILISDAGKGVLDVLESEFADRTSHVPGDPYTSAFNEGQRSVVLFLKDLVEVTYE